MHADEDVTDKEVAGAEFPIAGDDDQSADALLLHDMRRSSAVVDIVIMLLYLLAANVACQSWYGWRYRTVGEAAAMRDWYVAWVVADVGIVLLAYVLTRRHRLAASALGLRREALETQILWGLLGSLAACLLMFTFVGADVVFRRILRHAGSSVPWSWDAANEEQQVLSSLRVGRVLWMMVAAAITEEVMFRGILLPRFRRLTGSWWSAVALVSILFGLSHLTGGIVFVAGTAFVSIAFSLVFIASRSLAAAMVAHFLYNMAQYAIAVAQSG